MGKENDNKTIVLQMHKYKKWLPAQYRDLVINCLMSACNFAKFLKTKKKIQGVRMYKYLISLKIYYLFLVCPIPMNELQQYTAKSRRDL